MENRVMNENCKVNVVDVSLNDILAKLKVSQLKELAQVHKLKNRSKMKKQELVTALDTELKNPVNLNMLNEKATEKGAAEFSQLANATDQPTIDFWKSMGFVYELDGDNIVPQELLSQPQSTEGSSELNTLVKDYCRAAINLYGLITIDKFIEIFNSQNETKLNKESFTEIFNSQEIEYIKLHENYIIAEYILVSEDLSIDKVLANQADKPYFIPEKERYLQYSDDYYYDDSPQLQELKNYIIKNYTKDEEVIKNLLNDIQGLISVEASLDVILESFYKYNIQFKSAKQIKKIVPYVTNVQNNTKLYTNRGYTPNELRVMRGEKPQNINTQPIRSKKIGRNEPCPCGSGKKYKKCCL